MQKNKKADEAVGNRGEGNMQDSRKDILWVSMLAPYDTVGHAGGKIHNYYLKYLHKQDPYNVRVVSTYKESEADKLDLDSYGISHNLFMRRREGFLGLLCKALSWSSKSLVFNRYAGLTPADISYGIKKELRKLSKEGYKPDLVILDWTEVVFLAPYVKKLFPNAQYMAIEEDVSFQSLQRKEKNAANVMVKSFFRLKWRKVRKKEIALLNSMRHIIVNNGKDEELLRKNGVVKDIFSWAPFYEDYKDYKAKGKTKDIVFYGAMNRPENWKSAVWFIENVFQKIDSGDIRFVVAGGSPNPALKKYAGDRIVIMGWVEKVEEILGGALCMVAPLVLGAGIKIKILEAMSCGTIVLTNDIGIEGIPAQDGKEYFHCNTAEDYISVITGLVNGKYDAEEMSHNARRFMREKFDIGESSRKFVEIVEGILGGARNLPRLGAKQKGLPYEEDAQNGERGYTE